MPSNREIEAAIAADPDDEAGYRVYADWLEGEGDPRAELIRLMLQNSFGGNVGKSIRKLLATHQAHFLGPPARYREHQGHEMLTWRRGFLHAASFHRGVCNDVHDALAKLFDHPSGRCRPDRGGRSLRGHGRVR